MISRRALLGTAAAASLLRPKLLQAQTTGVTPVFIRWDAWYATGTAVDSYHAALSAPKWQSRAPWFSQVVSPYRIIAAGTQANMNVEIQAAANAGIKAWAFNWYGAGTGTPASPPGSVSLNAGWELYNASANKNAVKWCLMLNGVKDVGYSPWSNTAGWHANVDKMVTYLQQSNYLKVLSRPVIFVLWNGSDDLATYFNNSSANVTTAFNYLRTQCAAVSGLGDPYIVMLGARYDASVSSSALKPIVTGNAISNYLPALAPNKLPNSAAEMYALNQAWWTSQLATGDKVVPNVVMGFDKRPLMDLPPFGWPKPWIGELGYFTHPTNAEVATYLQGCIDVIGANAAVCESKMMLVYSWTECAEGGKAGIPTLGDPPTGSPPTTALLSAIKPVLTAAA